ncbi:hypothetical protein GpartN1_g5931.t1 [Galdieria partita]|uniref:Uncharacterized protein n=1 Tax=Galdieria partita TaxID=83374 RepID=A0A9C7UT58_9RHOD|nr:hypothetical protein GpartN1_g5931.t1 [Galdieria partita]
MSDTSERTTLPLLGFRAVRKSPKRKRSKKYSAELECLSHGSFPTERVVLSDSDMQTAQSSSESLTGAESEFLLTECYSDSRGYKTEPVSPRTPPMSPVKGERKLVTPMAPKKSVQESRNVSFFESEDNDDGGICHSCGRYCRLRPSVPVCFRLSCAIEYMNVLEER